MQEHVEEEFKERYVADFFNTGLHYVALADMLEHMEAQLATEDVDVKGVANVVEEISRRMRFACALCYACIFHSGGDWMHEIQLVYYVFATFDKK